jgi:hypothetical protein
MSINCQQSNPDLIPVEVDANSIFAPITLEQASRGFYGFDNTFTAKPDGLHPDHPTNGPFTCPDGTTGHFSRKVVKEDFVSTANWLRPDNNGMICAGGFQDFLEEPAGTTVRPDMYQLSHKVNGSGNGFEFLGERRIRPIRSVGTHDRGSTYVAVPVRLPDDASVRRYPGRPPKGRGPLLLRQGVIDYSMARSGTHGTWHEIGGPGAGNKGSWKDFSRGGQKLTHFTNTIRTADGAKFYAFEVPTGTTSIGGRTTTGFVQPLPEEESEEESEEEDSD